VVEALAPDDSDKPFVERVRAAHLHRCPQHRDAAPRRDASELRPVLAVIVVDQQAQTGAEGRHLTRLLRAPSVGRVPCDADVDDVA